MKTSVFSLASVAAVLAGFGLDAGTAEAGEFRFSFGHSPRYCPPPRHCPPPRVWCPPVYETRCRQVWCEPVYETRCRQIWCPPITRCEPVCYRDHCGRMVHEMRTIVVVPGHFETVREQVLVCAGRYKMVHEQVCVRPGHYE